MTDNIIRNDHEFPQITKGKACLTQLFISELHVSAYLEAIIRLQI